LCLITACKLRRGDKIAMGKKVKFTIGLVLTISIATWVYKTNASPKLTAEDKSKIVTLVNFYYNNMMNKEYESALKLIDITTLDSDKTILALNNNGYSLKRSLEGESWIIPINGRDEVFYDKEDKSFFTQTGALITYETDSFAVTENVYVSKVGRDFKITRITTDDRHGYIRGPFVKRLYRLSSE
jgi:hypothetical protein